MSDSNILTVPSSEKYFWAKGEAIFIIAEEKYFTFFNVKFRSWHDSYKSFDEGEYLRRDMCIQSLDAHEHNSITIIPATSERNTAAIVAFIAEALGDENYHAFLWDADDESETREINDYSRESLLGFPARSRTIHFLDPK